MRLDTRFIADDHSSSGMNSSNPRKPKLERSARGARKKRKKAPSVLLSGIVIEDLLAAGCLEIKRTASRLSVSLGALESAAQQAFDATGEMDRQEAAAEVLRRSHSVEGCA